MGAQEEHRPPRQDGRGGHRGATDLTAEPRTAAWSHRGASPTVAISAVTGLLLVIAAVVSPRLEATGAHPRHDRGPVLSSAAPHAPSAPTPRRTSLPRAQPVRLDIPAIDVHVRHLVELRRRPDGRLRGPRSWDAVGWYPDGPWPGQVGAASLAGHVDSRSGPAVFYRLRDLRPQDRIIIRRADNTVAVFTVYAVKQFAKSDFPITDVFGASDDAGLRLMTCGGSFNERIDSYRDNIVVYARLTDTQKSSQ